MQTLCELHAPLHQAVIKACLRFTATLTSLDLDATQRDWARFLATLHAHVEAEEAVIFPAGASLDLPPKASVEILERDHALIAQTCDRIAHLLQTLHNTPPSEQRALLARNLDPLVRLYRTLEHHGLREQELFYPLLDAHLSLSERQRVQHALLASAQSDG